MALVGFHVVSCIATPRSHHCWDGPSGALVHGAGESQRSQPGGGEGLGKQSVLTREDR